MKKTALSSCSKSHVHSLVSLRKPLRCGFAIALCSCLFYGASQCRAQESHQQDQDVAAAARQERTRREAEKSPPHVYTNEDLQRINILTPEDSARLEAARKLQSPLPSQQPTDSLDAGLPAELPLGDLARLYRSAKRATEPAFHFPAEEPSFASPVLPVDPGSIPHSQIMLSPAAPTIAPAHPKTIVAPHMSSSTPVRRVDPFSRRLMPVPPEATVAKSKPAIPVILPSRPSLPASANVAKPIAPSIKAASPVSPVNPIASAAPTIAAPVSSPAPEPISAPRVVTVQRGDSLWKIAEQTLGRGSRWRDLLAANPSIANPSVLEVGTQIRVPDDVRAPRTSRVKVNVGDTLTKIARAQYGHSSYWRCIAQANPDITNANRIYEGQELVLPPACKR